MRRNGFLETLILVIALTLAGCAGADKSGREVFDRGVVVSDHPLAAEAGARMLRLGGNAVDAAVAASFALSVLRPESCGIGGGGFMLIHLRNHPRLGDRDIALDYRERAPASARPDTFLHLEPGASRYSGNAVAVPGTVAGLLHALDRYGALDRHTVLAPAIELAQRGYPTDKYKEQSIKKLAETIATNRPGTRDSDALLRRIFLDAPPLDAPVRNTPPDAPPPRLIRNPEQARALQLIADQGASAFYGGEIGQAIVNQTGGNFNLRDLESYRITEARPLVGAFRSRTILAMPLPSSGGVTILQILRLIELRPDLLAGATPTAPRYLHLLAETFKLAFADRAASLGDPEFTPDPTSAILEETRLRARARTIDPNHARPASYDGSITPLPDDHGTSHLCAVDRWGSAVACTETINLAFGSRIAVPEFGFCLNNEMDDFLTRPGEPNAFGLTQSDRNLPAPGKRPLSSMAPTILLDRNGEVEIVAGASGGPRIITATTQAILNVLLFHLDAAHAVARARIHHQWSPDEVTLEALTPPIGNENNQIRAALAPLGHTITTSEDFGVTQLIRRKGRYLDAAADPRKNGAAVHE